MARGHKFLRVLGLRTEKSGQESASPPVQVLEFHGQPFSWALKQSWKRVGQLDQLYATKKKTVSGTVPERREKKLRSENYFIMRGIVLGVLIALVAVPIAAQTSPDTREPGVTLELAVAKAKSYVRDKHIDLSDAYLDSVVLNQNARGDRGKFWLITWQPKEFMKGGQVFVRVYMDGSVEHALGE